MKTAILAAALLLALCGPALAHVAEENRCKQLTKDLPAAVKTIWYNKCKACLYSKPLIDGPGKKRYNECYQCVTIGNSYPDTWTDKTHVLDRCLNGIKTNPKVHSQDYSQCAAVGQRPPLPSPASYDLCANCIEAAGTTVAQCLQCWSGFPGGVTDTYKACMTTTCVNDYINGDATPTEEHSCFNVAQLPPGWNGGCTNSAFYHCRNCLIASKNNPNVKADQCDQCFHSTSNVGFNSTCKGELAGLCTDAYATGNAGGSIQECYDAVAPWSSSIACGDNGAYAACVDCVVRVPAAKETRCVQCIHNNKNNLVKAQQCIDAL